MLKTVTAIAVVAAIPMLFVGSSSAVAQAQGAAETDRAPAPSATPSPQATTAKRLPIAYGYINTDGTVASGTANISSVFDSVNKWYAITITGRNYSSPTSRLS